MSTMSVKTGIKDFSSSSQGTLKNEKVPESVQREIRDNYGDGKSLGDVLNRVANSNWEDQNQRLKGVGNNQLNRDAFFQLMIAQMKNQDPTEPIKSHDMAAQLAQFSSLEKMGNIDETLIEMKSKSEPVERMQVLGFIGKTVQGDSSQIYHDHHQSKHDFQFHLPKGAEDVRIHVKDRDGQTLRSYNMKHLEEGGHQVSWNGRNGQGLMVPPGYYQFAIEAKTSEGNQLHVDTAFSGKVTGINYTEKGPVLLVGNKSVRLNEVRKIGQGPTL